jgi:hypothetical protein
MPEMNRRTAGTDCSLGGRVMQTDWAVRVELEDLVRAHLDEALAEVVVEPDHHHVAALLHEPELAAHELAEEGGGHEGHVLHQGDDEVFLGVDDLLEDPAGGFAVAGVQVPFEMEEDDPLIMRADLLGNPHKSLS